MSEHTPEPTTFQKAVEAVLNVAPGEIPVDGAPLIVRAVLEAVMEPDEGMIEAALDAHAAGQPFESPFGPQGSFATTYRSMLSAILREGQSASSVDQPKPQA